jgi:hypothetical protein
MTEYCPECGSVATQKGLTVDGDSGTVEINWWSCLSCDWDNR